MTELPARSRASAKNQNTLSYLPSRTPPDRKLRCRRRIQSSAFTAAGGNRRRSPATPLLKWKFYDSGDTLLKYREAVAEGRHTVSARRLAAGIRQLRLPKAGGGRMNLGLKSNGDRLNLPYSSHGNCVKLYPDSNNESSSPPAIQIHRGGMSLKPEAFTSLLNSSIERTTKWGLGYPKSSKNAYGLYDSLKFFEDCQSNKISIVSFLQSELELAQSRVSELEAEQQSAKEKLDHFIRKIDDQKAAWKRREHEKFRYVIDAMKEDLNRERKNRQRLEIMNAKIVRELTEAKLSAKKFLQEYDKESKARELMEEVCNELAKEIGDDKAEVEALKIESLKTREEVEEERKMLQMAEVWREERVQMKLIDAKLTLEDKYSQLSKLQVEIETFLMSTNGNNLDVSEVKQAEALKEAVGTVKTHDFKEFSYDPPPSSQDVFSIFEELQSREKVNEKVIEEYYGSGTLEGNGLSDEPMNGCNSLMFDENGEAEDSGWETVSHVEEQDSSKSPIGNEPFVNGEISEVFSVIMRQSSKKGPSISRFWRSSRARNIEDLKRMPFELTSGRLCKGRTSNPTLSPARKSWETGLSSPSDGNWSSPCVLTSNITEGMKGRLEWPWGSKKHVLKTKLMEAKIQGQKVQLGQVLKQQM